MVYFQRFVYGFSEADKPLSVVTEQVELATVHIPQHLCKSVEIAAVILRLFGFNQFIEQFIVHTLADEEFVRLLSIGKQLIRGVVVDVGDAECGDAVNYVVFVFKDIDYLGSATGELAVVLEDYEVGFFNDLD